MNTTHGLLWEQWRQSRYWIVGSGALLIMLAGLADWNRAWVLRALMHDLYELELFGWVAGFTAVVLLFVNQGMRDISLNFPRRQFALPCRTSRLLLSHLIFKSAAAAAIGVVVSLYLWILQETPSPTALPIYLFVALAAVAQALFIVTTLAGHWAAMASGLVASAIAFGIYLTLLAAFRLDEDSAARMVSVAVMAAGWLFSVASGPVLRHGKSDQATYLPRFAYDGQTLSLTLPRPVALRWDFTSPLWAQCWYEWRRVLVWVPRIVVPGVALITLAAVAGAFDEGEVFWVLLLALAASTTLICSYFLLRMPPAEGRFVLARPNSEQTVIDGKLLAALTAALATAALAAVVLALGACIAALAGNTGLAMSALRELPSVFLLLFMVLWVALTSSPIYLGGFAVSTTIGLLVISPAAALGAISESLAILYAGAVIVVIYLGLSRLHAKGYPIPWELGLAALAFLPDFLLFLGLTLPGIDRSGDDERIWFFLALFTLLGGLLFARRLGLISPRRCWAAFTGHFLVSLLAYQFVESLLRTGSFTGADTIFWWIAACFAPVVWVPLAVRLQRFR